MNYLVTGATGFLGGHMVRRLVGDGHSVRILRRQASSLHDIQDLSFEDVIGDITDPVAVNRAMVGIDGVIHAAAKISYWPQESRDIMHVNGYGTKCVADAALEAGVKRFVYVSSVMAVGIPEPGTLGDETLAYNFSKAPNPYSEGKHAGELFVQDAVARGLKAVIVNPGAIIGPVDRRRAVGGLFFPGKINRYFYVSGGMSAVDVADVVEGIVRAVERGRVGERYLLTGDNISYRQMRAVIAQLMGEVAPFISIPSAVLKVLAAVGDGISHLTHRRPRISLPMARFLPLELYYTSQKARSELGWRYRPFWESAEGAIRWYKSTTL